MESYFEIHIVLLSFGRELYLYVQDVAEKSKQLSSAEDDLSSLTKEQGRLKATILQLQDQTQQLQQLYDNSKVVPSSRTENILIISSSYFYFTSRGSSTKKIYIYIVNLVHIAIEHRNLNIFCS